MHKNIYITNLTNCWIKKVVFTELTVKVGFKKDFVNLWVLSKKFMSVGKKNYVG